MSGNERRAVVIQERDRRLLREIGVMRVIDREQAKTVAGFGSTTRVNVRLLALMRSGLLRRFFLGTTAGGKKALYALSAKGAELVGVARRGPRRRKDEALIADFFVEHQLAINEIYCALKFHPAVAGVTFRRWMAFHEPLIANLQLIPDGYVEFASQAGIVAGFLEIDLGHESLTVWKEKIRNYLQFAMSGDYERKFGQSRFRVLVLANSSRRLDSIRRTVAATTEKLFWFRTLESVHKNGFFAPLWLRPKSEQEHAFLRGTT
jgi:hypothetical protein